MKLLALVFIITGCSVFLSTPEHPKSAKKTHYSISFTHPDWFQKIDNKSDYVFENIKDARIYLSNSFCDEFQEQTLDRLAFKIFKNIKNFKLVSSLYTTFKGREAFRAEGDGLVDGVKVHLILMNTRRNNCYFDFLSISPSSVKVDSKSFDEFLDQVVFK